MSINTFLVILLVWSVAGFLAAIAFGKAVRHSDTTPDDEALASSASTIKYFRRENRKQESAQAAPKRVRNGSSKRESA